MGKTLNAYCAQVGLSDPGKVRMEFEGTRVDKRNSVEQVSFSKKILSGFLSMFRNFGLTVF